MSVNIQEVAKQAGVSIATVSRILNNLPGYSEKTRLKVEKTIAELGYTPNAIARGLVNKKTNVIGVLLPCVTGRFSNELLRGIERIAHSQGKSVIVCNTDHNGERTMAYLKTLSEKRVDGILYISEWLTDEYGSYLKDLGIPVVLVATHRNSFPFSSVKIDDAAAAESATRYLIAKGHAHIGLITGSASDRIAGKPRIDGYLKALKEASIEIDDSLIAYGDFHFFSGITAMEKLYDTHPELTAVFATSDEMALGAIAWLHKNNIRIPQQVSVIGYDDTLDAQIAFPSLTTIHQGIEELGETAMRLLTEEQSIQQIILPHFVKERDSVQDIRE
ncbi:transcriptional regulator [Sphaerochaeta pleomorpha str. Grapes]|uniref:Transcriptional regulator n=1 Tax=Sphaerochaeta pleomorpha (strain ATCC BAA-1885 / DSM 22778 / Grapes) TaxID=158190 RepID=G8QUM4_SPHPG|nr:LacI family DNA-binding transcriptional regulator [Sphaerochaeta pleomorpha]AEV30332.1 transcriptional regulator [Sphaerochaeta pleomorpha str. Grapes]